MKTIKTLRAQRLSKRLLRTGIGLSCLLAVLLPADAATLTWNRNLTPDDTAYYSMWDDANWSIEGEHSGNTNNAAGGWHSGDIVIIPNGIAARLEDPTTGAGKVYAGRNLIVGSAEPGTTSVTFKNNFSSGNFTLEFSTLLQGDPDNDTDAEEYTVYSAAGGRTFLLKGTGGSAILRNCTKSGGTIEFYGSNIVGRCGSGNSDSAGMIQIRVPNNNPKPVSFNGTISGRVEFRSGTGPVTATPAADIRHHLVWREDTRRVLMLGDADHIVGNIRFSDFGGNASAGIVADGGTLTMKQWSENRFTGNTASSFDLSRTTVRLFGNGVDSGILLAVRGRDDGPVKSGYVDNFAFGSLVVGDDAGDGVTLTTQGAYAEGAVSPAAALYVGTLDLSSGAGLVIPEGTVLYYQILIGTKANVTGTDRLIGLPLPTSVSIR